MQKTIINDNYEYWYFEKQSEYFSSLEELLADEYTITDSLHLCVEASKEEKSIFIILYFCGYN